MKRIIFLLLLMGSLFLFIPKIFAQSKARMARTDGRSLAYDPYKSYPVYQGDDLGMHYSPSMTILKVWSPPAEEMKLKLYRSSSGNDLAEEVSCSKDAAGVWTAELGGDRKNFYYTFQSKINGTWNNETPDPYAIAVGTNGKRGEIIDLRETDPEGWERDRSPELKSQADVILYELHVRDMSVSPNSGIERKGKFAGFTEEGTKNSYGQSTGVDHIAEMGVTHVHLLPVFDFCSIDESRLSVQQYNWGYDPQNYNVPEGSYSTNPADGLKRIMEFKELVQSMHRQGLRVVMDVVYNHTGLTHDSGFDQLVPGYYYRQWEKDGKYGNASGCGNETASDRAMVRKFIVESVVYWVKEYHIDGFRFDLMAVHDMETMSQVSAALHAIDPSIIIYGEGWTAGDSPLPVKYRALKANVKKMNGIAVFSDDIRDAIKGSVFDDKSTGFASGAKDMAESVKFGIVAGGEHPQVDYTKVKYSKEPYTHDPVQVINYVSCHDNQTLYDKLKTSRPDATEGELIRMHKLANTIVLTSQGIPFLFAGEEMKRTKKGEHNSYNKPDSVNQIDWDAKYEYRDLVEYYKDLIALRKAHPAFRMETGDMVRKNLVFLPVKNPQLIAYRLDGIACHDAWKQIIVIFNGSDREKQVSLPAGKWKVALQDYRFRSDGTAIENTAAVSACSATIAFME